MITKSPYGFGHGHKGRIAGTEPDGEIKPVKTYDSQEDIDYCLSCPEESCKGKCKRLREFGCSYRPKKYRL